MNSPYCSLPKQDQYKIEQYTLTQCQPQQCRPAPPKQVVYEQTYFPVCDDYSQECEYVEETRKAYNMSIKPIWKVVIAAVILFFVFVFLAFIISYFANTTTLYDIYIDVPETTLTIDAVYEDNIKFTATVGMPGGIYYENSGETTISQYTAILNSAISGELRSSVVGNDSVRDDAAIINYDSKTKTFTIALKDADAVSIYSTELEYWRDFGFSVGNTLSLIDEDSCIDNFSHYMDSMTSMPILSRPPRSE